MITTPIPAYRAMASASENSAENSTAVNNQNENSSKLSSNILAVINGLYESPSHHCIRTARESSTLYASFIGKLVGAKSPDASPSHSMSGRFAQIHSLYGGQRGEHYKTLDRYLTVPDKISLMDVNIRERKITATEITLGWSQKSPAFSPLDSEKAQNGVHISEQFLQDLNRSNYIIELPGFDGNQIELNMNMSDREKIEHLHNIFGEGNTKVISEIAHQGHMAEFASTGLAMCNDEHILSQGDVAPQFIISKQEDGRCRITSSLIFDLKT